MRLLPIPKSSNREPYRELAPDPSDISPSLSACSVTVDMRIRNEARTIRQAIESILPVARRIIITDTGSDDGTLDIVNALAAEHQDRITLRRESHPDMSWWTAETRPANRYRPLTDIRQRVIDEADTDWVWVVDGDEVYTCEALRNVQAALNHTPEDIWCVFLDLKWVVDDHTIAIATDMKPMTAWSVGRLFRRDGLYLRGAFMGEQHCAKRDEHDEAFWYGSPHAAVLRAPGFHHYEIVTKPKRRTVLTTRDDFGIPHITGWPDPSPGTVELPNTTLHMMVRNEYPTAFFALMSVLPVVSQAIVVDTGSTDGTVDILRRVRDAYPHKVRLYEFDLPDSTQWSFFKYTRENRELGRMRQWMNDRTETEYIWLIDGDEVYRDSTVRAVSDYLRRGMPSHVNVAFLPLLWFAQDIHHIGDTNPRTYNITGRLFRRNGLHIKGSFPGEMAAYDGEVVGPDSRHAEILRQLEPFHHYEMVTKPWRRKLLELREYAGAQPEVFERHGERA
jgi:glycosyltransferase involved in cell wall biosynthesis